MPHIEIHGNIHSSDGGQIFIGNTFNQAFNNLVNSGQAELAKGLQELATAIQTNQELNAGQKQEYIEVVTEMTAEAGKSQPNRSKLKMLGQGLLDTLKLVPGMLEVVDRILPYLQQWF